MKNVDNFTRGQKTIIVQKYLYSSGFLNRPQNFDENSQLTFPN